MRRKCPNWLENPAAHSNKLRGPVIKWGHFHQRPPRLKKLFEDTVIELSVWRFVLLWGVVVDVKLYRRLRGNIDDRKA